MVSISLCERVYQSLLVSQTFSAVTVYGPLYTNNSHNRIILLTDILKVLLMRSVYPSFSTLLYLPLYLSMILGRCQLG